jgi:hypothetical protein
MEFSFSVSIFTSLQAGLRLTKIPTRVISAFRLTDYVSAERQFTVWRVLRKRSHLKHKTVNVNVFIHSPTLTFGIALQSSFLNTICVCVCKYVCICVCVCVCMYVYCDMFVQSKNKEISVGNEQICMHLGGTCRFPRHATIELQN